MGERLYFCNKGLTSTWRKAVEAAGFLTEPCLGRRGTVCWSTDALRPADEADRSGFVYFGGSGVKIEFESDYARRSPDDGLRQCLIWPAPGNFEDVVAPLADSIGRILVASGAICVKPYDFSLYRFASCDRLVPAFLAEACGMDLADVRPSLGYATPPYMDWQNKTGKTVISFFSGPALSADGRIDQYLGIGRGSKSDRRSEEFRVAFAKCVTAVLSLGAEQVYAEGAT